MTHRTRAGRLRGQLLRHAGADLQSKRANAIAHRNIRDPFCKFWDLGDAVVLPEEDVARMRYSLSNFNLARADEMPVAHFDVGARILNDSAEGLSGRSERKRRRQKQDRKQRNADLTHSARVYHSVLNDIRQKRKLTSAVYSSTAFVPQGTLDYTLAERRHLWFGNGHSRLCWWS